MITDLRGIPFYIEGNPMLVTSRFLLSIEWSLPETDRYYWEHCTYLDTTQFGSLNGAASQNLVNMALFYTSQVRFHSQRLYNPATMAVLHQQNYPVSQDGNQPNTVNYNLLVSARWRLWGSDGSYSYHLHRLPFGEAHLEDGTWSAFGWTRANAHLNTFIMQGDYRTKTGSLITRGEVAPNPVGWQLRHGTKRSQKRFWLP